MTSLILSKLSNQFEEIKVLKLQYLIMHHLYTKTDLHHTGFTKLNNQHITECGHSYQLDYLCKFMQILYLICSTIAGGSRSFPSNHGKSA